MGPLAPYEIISENTNFLLAFFIGIAFGWVLESSGFSSSRKLAGIFYGYDTVVLKVFFTGAITAMLGLLFMSLFGWVDLDLVYVNPTYLTSAIVGGVIMGAGFHHGRLLPGYQLLRQRPSERLTQWYSSSGSSSASTASRLLMACGRNSILRSISANRK
ncbi:MAG: hypothetical protein MZV63_66900 [Marinilabiliales bacterium]|nr:hypothetical protein [Marinilabiliales bacterium]